MRIFLRFILLCFGAVALSGCMEVSSVWTGASMIYDRHELYKKFNDYQLAAVANRALYHDTLFKREGVIIDVAALNGDLLIVGHVPNESLRQVATRRITNEKLHYRRFFNQIAVGNYPNNTVEDSWITAKIRSLIVADAEINPNQFKVITVDKVVYLMGDALAEDAVRVINIARSTEGVIRVVKLFKFYRYLETT